MDSSLTDKKWRGESLLIYRLYKYIFTVHIYNRGAVKLHVISNEYIYNPHRL